jgi:hypothetical protein
MTGIVENRGIVELPGLRYPAPVPAQRAVRLRP